LVIIGDAATPGLGLCHQHAIVRLEQRKPGAEKRIRRGTMRGWVRNTGPMRAVWGAMMRAGLIRNKPIGLAHGPRRCKARAKSTGVRCKRWAAKNSVVCRVHGAKGKGPWNSAKRGDPILARQARIRAEKQHRRDQARLERQRRWAAGMLPMSARFPEQKPLPTDATPMELEFRSHHRPRSGGKVDYER
jgi:hypothetical protein